jgi:UDP-N-acetylmuramate dehydrogenase
MTNLSELTTLHVGGPATKVLRATSEEELIAAVSAGDAAGTPLLIIGGGSNLLVSDAGFDGTVIVVETRGNSYEIDACSGGMLQVAAGTDWDEFVAFTLEKKLANLESLSGIPGTVGAAPIQNIGAYGHEVSEVIARVRTYDRHEKAIKTFTADQCEFTYRDSIFKRSGDRYVILDVTFQLRRGEYSLAVKYKELADALGVDLDARVPTLELREAVLALRAKKGMLYNEAVQNWSAGSFFVNPIISAEQAATLPENAPRWAQEDGRVKIPAAWLMENSGVVKGEGINGAKISERHVLAIANAGGATTEDIIALARSARTRVQERFGITLTPEVRFVGVEL